MDGTETWNYPVWPGKIIHSACSLCCWMWRLNLDFEFPWIDLFPWLVQSFTHFKLRLSGWHWNLKLSCVAWQNYSFRMFSLLLDVEVKCEGDYWREKRVIDSSMIQYSPPWFKIFRVNFVVSNGFIDLRVSN